MTPIVLANRNKAATKKQGKKIKIVPMIDKGVLVKVHKKVVFTGSKSWHKKPNSSLINAFLADKTIVPPFYLVKSVNNFGKNNLTSISPSKGLLEQ